MEETLKGNRRKRQRKEAQQDNSVISSTVIAKQTNTQKYPRNRSISIRFSVQLRLIYWQWGSGAESDREHARTQTLLKYETFTV